MKIKRITLYAIAFAFVYFCISFVVLPLYIGGDQVHYRHFYEALPKYSFYDGFAFYQEAVGSREPGYYLVCYLFSGWLEKSVLMSMLNALLGGVGVYWLLKNRVSMVVILLLALNFYLMVLFFSAERLKLAILCLTVASCCSGVYRYSWVVGGVLSHVQSVILLLSKVGENVAAAVPSLLRGRLKYSLILAMLASLLLAVLLFLMRDHIAVKLNHFIAHSGGFQHIVKPLIFTVFTIYYAKQYKFQAVAMQAPIILIAFIVGGERVVIFSYFVFMYYALQVNRGLNIGVLLFSLYFLIKGVLFIQYIILYGNGFFGSRVI